MSHQQIIQTLIEWIDEHIDQPLNIDVVAKKSGYSKWYLQADVSYGNASNIRRVYSPAPSPVGGR